MTRFYALACPTTGLYFNGPGKGWSELACTSPWRSKRKAIQAARQYGMVAVPVSEVDTFGQQALFGPHRP